MQCFLSLENNDRVGLVIGQVLGAIPTPTHNHKAMGNRWVVMSLTSYIAHIPPHQGCNTGILEK